jgi:glycogen operon protein
MAFGNVVIDAGKAIPLGAAPSAEGVNFALFSRHAKAVTLIPFESAAPDSPRTEIPLNKREYRTGDIWHCFVWGLKAGACYLYRIDGPYVPEKGLRFNPHKTLIDPYAKALTDINRCIIINENDFNWDGDAPLN